MENEKSNSIGNIHPIESGELFGIKSENSPFAESFYFQDFYDEKAVKRFIKNVERLIRTSLEYKAYIENLRTNINALNHDAVLGNISTNDVDLEFHHYPFSLYELVEIVMINNVMKKIPFTSFSVAKKVMELHNKHLVGLVPLTKTMHELAHSGSIFIGSGQIFGDYKKFMSIFDKSINIDLKNKIANMENYVNIGVPNDFKGLL